MEFRTEYKPCKSALRLSPRHPVLLIGSCFSENIGSLMRECLWDARINPCGTLFNPMSIATVIRYSIGHGKPDTPWADTGGIWRSWDFPTAMAGESREECGIKCDEVLAALRKALTDSRLIIVTFGSAFVYNLKESGKTVANCHKRPSELFEKRLLTAEEIAGSWIALLRELRERYSALKAIFTVSPVRHVRDGFAANSLSKATLRLAVEKICRQTDAEYFPAYEILTDDLRDYRFYDTDLVHPSETAAAYIFDKFCETYLDPEDALLLRQGEKLSHRCAHRPLTPGSGEARKFAAATAEMIALWKENNPEMLIPETLF